MTEASPSPKKRLLIWLAAVSAAALLLWFLTAPAPDNDEKIPAVAPALTFPDLAGKTVSVADYKGKVVLLAFWATWCEPCIEEIPDLLALQKKYQGKDFTVLAVAADLEGAKTVAPFAKKHGLTYPILVSRGDIPETYPVPGFPTAFLIDKEGKIAARYLGGQTVDDFSKDIDAALAR
jgi:peroxiredoxin